jgi:hypothetical protein
MITRIRKPETVVSVVGLPTWRPCMQKGKEIWEAAK